MRSHLPILRTAAAAAGSFLAVVVLEAPSPSDFGALHIAFFAAGVLYTQFFEHLAHRVGMHRRVRFLEGVRFRHLVHHRIFHGSNFRTTRPSDLEHIAGHYCMFPVLISIHYLALLPVLSPNELTAFLFGTVLHYIGFEATHWFTHIENNSFDRFVSRIPGLRDIRAHQIEHHRAHHQVPEIAFNFNPPYLGDILAGKLPTPATVPGAALPRASAGSSPVKAFVPGRPAGPDPTVVTWKHPLVRYGSAVAAGLAIVGLVVVAHGRWSQSKTSAPSPETLI
ncbi:MAG TPA: hypothetical protein VLK65_29620 [Vicinamibacteria bacterium]|nr:hypothetical protein [Vicinamibacteria bacterium]